MNWKSFPVLSKKHNYITIFCFLFTKPFLSRSMQESGLSHEKEEKTDEYCSFNFQPFFNFYFFYSFSL